MKVKELIQMVLDGHIDLDDKLSIYVYDKLAEVYEQAEIVATGRELKNQVDLFCEVLREEE
tara:strand:- start:356 stop:538 length:183 start_codon:yes stop_codon:yes gene_type:complete